MILPELTLARVFDEDSSWVATLSGQRVRTLIATGDVIPARTVNFKTIEQDDWMWPYAETAEFLSQADITVINLETPLLRECTPTNEGMIFCGDGRHVEGLQASGVDVATVGNNHFGNYGQAGVTETVKILTGAGIEVTGLGEPALVEIDGIMFGFLAYNDVGVSEASVASADNLTVVEDIVGVRSEADVVVVAFHWGEEYRLMPTWRQEELAHLAVDSGADLVLGNHPHWIQPVEIYNGKTIVYAHGNFVFDQMWSRETREGVVGKYTFFDNNLIDVDFYPILIESYGQPFFLTGLERENILKRMKEASESLKMEAKLSD